MSRFIPGKLYRLKAGLGFSYPKEQFYGAVYLSDSITVFPEWGGESIELDKNSVLMYLKSFSFQDEDEEYMAGIEEPIVHRRKVTMRVFLFGEILIQLTADDCDVLELV